MKLLLKPPFLIMILEMRGEDQEKSTKSTSEVYGN